MENWQLWLGVAVLVPLAALAVVALLVFLMPHAFPRFLATAVLNAAYRITITGRENVPKSGPVVLMPNHVSWLDGLLVQYASPRPGRFIVYAGNFRFRWLKWLAAKWKTILMDTNAKSIARALKEARQALDEGDVLCVFPEGSISRGGTLQSFKPGITKVRVDPSVPVVPVYVTGVWSTIFSYQGGRSIWKWPKGFRLPLGVTFGQPVYPRDLFEYRQELCKLGARAVSDQLRFERPLATRMIASCKRRKFRPKLWDSSGESATGGAALMRALILRRLLRRHVLSSDEQVVGILLPPSIGGVLTNLAMLLDRRVTVNLNYTLAGSVLDDCLRRADVRHVLTTRRVLEKLELNLNSNLVFLEDLRSRVTWMDKLVAGFQTFLMPGGLLARWLGMHRVQPDDNLTIVFTSGSTGVPKGVMLTQRNILSNALAIEQAIRLTPDDVITGILPFFHSFGLTVTLHAVMALDVGGAYHFSPLDARQVGKLVRERRCTILLATPTFLRGYMKRCSKEDFASLDTVVAGAEKLPKELSDEFESKFGVRPVEGYGTTELSPLVSVNIPASRRLGGTDVNAREGSVGRTLPGVAAKVVEVDTGRQLGADEPGMLLISGPNVMKGYLGQPELTAKVIHDGWYETGDIARLDADGFIHITDRQSRFSKIGGEMVPHGRIEEELLRHVGSRDEERQPLAVTAIPDQRKGERLVVLLDSSVRCTPQELRDLLRSAGLPNLYIPSEDSFLQVAEIPVLGTGKVDLKRVKQLALERLAGTGAEQ